MKYPYNPNLSFDTILNQIEDVTSIATALKIPFANTQIEPAGYNILRKRGCSMTNVRWGIKKHWQSTQTHF